MTDAEYDAEFNRCLDRVKAEAWDEGYFRRMDDYPFDPEERDNPYRKEQS